MLLLKPNLAPVAILDCNNDYYNYYTWLSDSVESKVSRTLTTSGIKLIMTSGP